MRGVIRMWFNPAALQRLGSTPDYRFSLANERTFLAWIRTGLALIAGGLAIAQFLPEPQTPYLREGLAVALLTYGAAVALRALNHWIRCERAMRLGENLPESRFPTGLAVSVVLGAVLLIVVVIVEGLGQRPGRPRPGIRVCNPNAPGWPGGGQSWPAPWRRCSRSG